MKKVLALALAVIMLVCFAACGGSKVETFEGQLADVVTAMYEKQPVEFMVAPATEIDLTDAYAVNSYLGLGEIQEDAEGNAAPAGDVGIKEAYFSESMIGAQAYSLVLARVNDTAKLEEIKKAMFEGINTRKWICVEADQLRVVSYGDVIMLVMASSSLAEGLADGMVKAFAESVTGAAVEDVATVLTGEVLTRG